MEAKKETQRWAIMDIIELVANMIATYSHLYELYNSDVVQMDKYIEDPSIMDDEEAREVQQRLMEYEWLLEDSYTQRKIAMSMLKDRAVKYDKNMHCLLKHAIAQYVYSQEVRDTDRSNVVAGDLATYCSQHLHKILSMYLWVEVSLCARCLQDAMEDLQKK